MLSGFSFCEGVADGEMEIPRGIVSGYGSWVRDGIWVFVGVGDRKAVWVLEEVEVRVSVGGRTLMPERMEVDDFLSHRFFIVGIHFSFLNRDSLLLFSESLGPVSYCVIYSLYMNVFVDKYKAIEKPFIS